MVPVTLLEPFRAVFYAPFYAMVARGALRAEGVDVTVETVGDPAAAAGRLLAGRGDLAWSGPMRVILEHGRDAGCPLRSFGAVVMGDPFLLVGRGAAPDGFGIAQLGRYRLGSVSEVPTPWFCLQDDLRRIGVAPGSVPRVTGPGMGENVDAVLRGELDLAQVFEPHAALAEARGGVVWDAAASRGPVAYSTLYATVERIAARREEFAAIVRAMAATLTWLHGAAPAELAATVAGWFPELSAEVLATALGRYQRLGIWARTPRFERGPFERLEAAMLSDGAIPRAPGFDACVDAGLNAVGG